ncbi:MAG TPA: glycosyltransferase family 4 protein [Opitutaceae bacterium]
MNIVLVLPQLVYGRHGGFVGGYVNSVINLATVLQSQCALTLVAGVAAQTVEGEAELSQRLNTTKLCLIPMKSRPSSAAYFAEFSWKARKIGRELRNDGIDFIYGHSGHPGYGLSTWLVSRASGARPVHALYCPVSEEFQHRKMGRTTRLLVTEAFRRVPTMVAISENVRNSIKVFTGNRSDAKVMLPAIPDDFVAVCGNVASPAVRRPLVMGFVGHHKPEKGFDLALAAIKTAGAQGREVSLLALTSGAESQGQAVDQVRAMISEQGLADKVRLVKGIKDIRDFYSQVDLMLIPFRGTRGPSDYPMVLLEAMSLGVPVACTPVGAMPEVVRHGENGFLSADASNQAFGAAVAEAISSLDSRRAEIAGQALATAARFRAAQVSLATLHFLQQLNTTHTS